MSRGPNANDVGIPHLRPNNISPEGLLNFSEIKYIYANAKDIAKYSIIGGDILFNNTNSLKLVGKTAYFDLDGSYLISNHLTRIRADRRRMDSEFLAFYLYFLWQVNVSRRFAKQWDQAAIDLVDLSRVQVPLPSLMEQRKIAAIIRQARYLNQFILQAYDKIRDVPLALYIEMFGHPIDNPKDWKKEKLGELGEWNSGGTPPRSRNDYFLGNIPWYTSGELGELRIQKSKECISEDAIRETSAKLIKTGSLLIGMYDTAALKSSIVDGDSSCNQAIAFSKLDDNRVNTEFAYYTIQIGKEYFRRLQRGARQKNLNLRMIKDISIPIPPLSLQDEYAKKLSTIEEMIILYSKLLGLFNSFLRALLVYAFTGKLTADWRENFLVKKENDKIIESKIISAATLVMARTKKEEIVRVTKKMQKELEYLLQQIIESQSVLRPNVTAGFLSSSQIILKLLADKSIKDEERIDQMKLLISQLPNEKHPRFGLLDELSNEQYQIYLAIIMNAELYLVAGNIADDNSLPIISIQRGLELLDALGLTLCVNFPALHEAKTISYLPFSRLLRHKEDDAKFDDLAILGETQQ
jgi:type I restriction enzyme, S subunit